MEQTLRESLLSGLTVIPYHEGRLGIQTHRPGVPDEYGREVLAFCADTTANLTKETHDGRPVVSGGRCPRRLGALVGRQHSHRTTVGRRPLLGRERLARRAHRGDRRSRAAPRAHRLHPRASFAGFDTTTRWDAVQVAYFISYALWNYLTEPFLLTYPVCKPTRSSPGRRTERRGAGCTSRSPTPSPPTIPSRSSTSTQTACNAEWTTPQKSTTAPRPPP